jgi:hypothetical protein
MRLADGSDRFVSVQHWNQLLKVLGIKFLIKIPQISTSIFNQIPHQIPQISTSIFNQIPHQIPQFSTSIFNQIPHQFSILILGSLQNKNLYFELTNRSQFWEPKICSFFLSFFSEEFVDFGFCQKTKEKHTIFCKTQICRLQKNKSKQRNRETERRWRPTNKS